MKKLTERILQNRGRLFTISTKRVLTWPNFSVHVYFLLNNLEVLRITRDVHGKNVLIAELIRLVTHMLTKSAWLTWHALLPKLLCLSRTCGSMESVRIPVVCVNRRVDLLRDIRFNHLHRAYFGLRAMGQLMLCWLTIGDEWSTFLTIHDFYHAFSFCSITCMRTH